MEGPYDSKTESYGQQIYLLHRLDKETSGILLCARDADVAKKLKGMFEEGK